MPRASFQVLFFPYALAPDGTPAYAVFRRADLGVWQAVAGGGEVGETPEQAARREAWEEARVPPEAPLRRLAAVGQVPATAFRDRAHWPPTLATIPEFCFAVAAAPEAVLWSAEHDRVEWLSYQAAYERLHWASNRVALAELHAALTGEPAT
jgi:dihydroneopterin triphosphate diphosphatase